MRSRLCSLAKSSSSIGSSGGGNCRARVYTILIDVTGTSLALIRNIVPMKSQAQPIQAGRRSFGRGAARLAAISAAICALLLLTFSLWNLAAAT
jgi:hypothetical protein